MNVLEGREKPKLVFLDGAADCAYVILTGERLLGIGCGIFDGETRVEVGCALVESAAAVPIVGTALGGDDDRTGGGASGVGVFLGGAHGEFLDVIGREVLQESADVVVGIVAAIHGELVVQPGAAAGGNRGDASFGRVGGLDRLGSRGKIGDVGEAASRQGQGFVDPASKLSPDARRWRGQSVAW